MAKYKKSKQRLLNEVELARSVIKLKQQGYSTSDIADELNISAPTVRKYARMGSNIWQDMIDDGVNTSEAKIAWYKTDDYSVLLHNPYFNEKTISEMLNSAISVFKEEIKPRRAPRHPQNRAVRGLFALLLHPSDTHIGSEVSGGLEAKIEAKYKELLSYLKHFPIEEVILTSCLDFIHVDTPFLTTTKGTQMVTDGSTHVEMFERSVRLYKTLIDMLISKYRVRFVHVAANHDRASNYFLSRVLEAYYSKDKNIEFIIDDNQRKYLMYGDNLLAFEHGDKASKNQLPLLIAAEAPELWGKAKYRYAFIGHYHHQDKIIIQTHKEFNGLQVEWLTSVAKADKHHRENGYVTKPSLQSFLFHKHEGEIARFTQSML